MTIGNKLSIKLQGMLLERWGFNPATRPGSRCTTRRMCLPVFGEFPATQSLRLLVIAGTVCLLAVTDSKAESAAALIDAGNRAFQSGTYNDALSKYEKASVQAPESPVVFFNKGDALFRKGDYAGASDMFEKAAVRSKDLKLEAMARFNLGNCSFREAERQKDSDLKKALSACQTSIQCYQEALKLNPNYKPAAENIEVVRLTMKTILDEIKKQEEQAAKQQAQQKDAAERMKQLIDKQDRAIEKSKALAKEKASQTESKDTQNKSQDLADEQKNIQKDTDKLAEEMKAASQSQKQGQSQKQPDAGNKTAEHLNKASGHQEGSVDKLRKNSPEQAQPEQAEASKELKEALKSMAGEPKQGGDDQKPQDQKDQDKRQQEQSQKEQGEQDQSGQQQTSKVDEKVRDVLNEEKANKDLRSRQATAPYGDVDKNW